MSAYAFPGLFPPIEKLHGTKLDCRGIPRRHLVNVNHDECQKIMDDVFLQIRVRSAKLDPSRLVHALTTRHDDSINHCFYGSTKSSRVRQRGYSSFSNNNNNNEQGDDMLVSQSILSPYERAIDFELEATITVEGIETSSLVLTRSFGQIVQMRHDLVTEIREHEPFSPHRASDDEIKLIHQLPPLPRFGLLEHDFTTNEISHSYEVGGGFALWHARLHSFTPRLEKWLQEMIHFTALDTQCLTSITSNESFDSTISSESDSFDTVSSSTVTTSISSSLLGTAAAQKLRWAWLSFLSEPTIMENSIVISRDVNVGTDRKCVLGNQGRSHSLDRIEETEKDDDDDNDEDIVEKSAVS
jgi:hypothetical protein